MSNNRKRKFDQISNPELTDIPPHTKPISRLCFDFDEKKAIKVKASAHQVQPAKKLKTSKSNAHKVCFFKKNTPGSVMSQLEAYNAAIYKLIATSNYVPSVTAYYQDETNQFLGVGSNAISDFKANADDPLVEEDLVLNNHECQVAQQINILKLKIDELINHIAKSSKESFIFSQMKAVINFYVSNKFTETTFKQHLMNWLNNTSNISPELINHLDNIIKKRQEYIVLHSKDAIHNENQMLGNILEVIAKLNTLINKQPIKEFDIQEFERTELNEQDKSKETDEKHRDRRNYKIIKGLAVSLTARHIFKEEDLQNHNLSKYGFLIDFDMSKWNILYLFKRLNPIEEIMRHPNKDTFACTEHDIRHFPDLRDASPYYWPTKQTMVTNHSFKIISKFLDKFESFFIEADDAIYKKVVGLTSELATTIYQSDEEKGCFDRICSRVFVFLLRFKSYLIKTPEHYTDKQRKEIFKIIQSHILSQLSEYHLKLNHLEEKITDHVGRPKHRFSERDNEIYKKLKTHPVFIFHKFKTLLKYILTDKKIYNCIAVLHFQKDQTFVDKNNEKHNLITELVNDEDDRINEIKTVLLRMPEFKEFLTKQGRYAFELIIQELGEYKQKYLKRASKNSFYKNLLDAIDLNEITARFKEILNATQAENVLTVMPHQAIGVEYA